MQIIISMSAHAQNVPDKLIQINMEINCPLSLVLRMPAILLSDMELAHAARLGRSNSQQLLRSWSSASSTRKLSCQSTPMWAFPESSDMAVKLWDPETSNQVLLYRANTTPDKKCFVLFYCVSPSCSQESCFWEWEWLHLSRLIPSPCSAEHEITQLLEPWTRVSLLPLSSWFSLCSFALVLDSGVEQSVLLLMYISSF